MLKLHQSFTALHAQRTQARAVTCELCPMHQLHKLCREIEGLEAEKAINILGQVRSFGGNSLISYLFTIRHLVERSVKDLHFLNP